MLIRVDAPSSPSRFCAGVETDGEDRVILRTAPILKWTIGKTVDELWRWCKAKGYTCERADKLQTCESPPVPEGTGGNLSK